MTRAQWLLAALVLAFVGMGAAGPLNYSAAPQTGRLAAASVTHTTAGTADTVKTFTGGRRILLCTNSLDKETELTWAGADFIYLPAGTPFSIDLGASSLAAANNVTIGIYHLGVQPTTGSIACSAF